MYTSHYFTELIVRERQRQWVAEADRSRRIREAKLTGINNRKQIIGSLCIFLKDLGAYFIRKHEPSICGCYQGR